MTMNDAIKELYASASVLNTFQVKKIKKMSGSIPASGSEMYAVVDLSKKRKKKRIANIERESALDSKRAIPMYAVVDKNRGRIGQRDKNTEILNECLDNNSSTEIAEDQEKIKDYKNKISYNVDEVMIWLKIPKFGSQIN